ncbi:MAG TPA: penicillin-binding transpeptidase domain-containing protein [Solirubrobacterales bacterium]
MSSDGSAAERRRRILTRAAPLVVIATLAFAGGIVIAGGPDAPAAQRFVDAWERGDIAAMYAELTPEAQAEYSLERFRRTYDDATITATIAELSTGEVSEQGDAAVTAVRLRTHIFGELGGELAVPISDDKVAWTPNLVYPGLASDEHLSRRTRAPARAAILATDRTPLAEGPAAARTVGTAALAVVGEVGTPTGAQQRELAVHGFPPGSLTGISGLELAYNQRLAGQPGGQLLAVSAGDESQVGGGRILATTQPVRGKAVRTTIDPDVQESAVTALGSTYGGAAVLDAKTGSVLGLSGLAYSAPQPPGSTFKIITATGALDAGIVKLSDEFPVESSNSEIGREIPNAHDELCGGSFATAFAESCNTVFAPLGARLGGEKLVETAELYGFNSPPELFDPATTAIVDPASSTIPATLSESVETGESAIGQGRVLATPLEMASASQTIANKGVRMPNAIAHGEGLVPTAPPVKVTTPQTAATMTQLMIGVVNEGTGVAAALPGIQVAGKTGTAELGPAALEPGQELGPGEEPPQDTDAWFTAFAPAGDPEIAVAVMVVNSDGDGGTVAAPIVRQIMADYFNVA